jgi:hypothetical protein
LELAGRHVTVREKLDGQLQILHRTRKLTFKELPERPPRIQAEKSEGASNKRKEDGQRSNRPWSKFGFATGRAYWNKIKDQNSPQPSARTTVKKGDILNEAKQGTF